MFASINCHGDSKSRILVWINRDPARTRKNVNRSSWINSCAMHIRPRLKTHTHTCTSHGGWRRKGNETVNVDENVARSGKEISYSQNVQNAWALWDICELAEIVVVSSFITLNKHTTQHGIRFAYGIITAIYVGERVYLRLEIYECRSIPYAFLLNTHYCSYA